MFSVSNNGIVTVNRGDSFELPIVLNIGNDLRSDNYVLKETDVVVRKFSNED